VNPGALAAFHEREAVPSHTDRNVIESTARVA
jgi:hypothetical protein